MKALLKAILFVLFLMESLTSQAQKISVGVKTGVQTVNVEVPGFVEDASFLPDFKDITTFNIGAVSEIELHRNFALQPELNYLQKGFQVEEGFDLDLFNIPLPVGVMAISKFHYLELPLLAKAKFGNEFANFYVLAGPTFGYAMAGNLKTRAKLLVEIDMYNTNIDLGNVGYQRWEVGGMAGAGISLNTKGGGQFFVDARYSHGFTQPYDIPLVHEKVRHKNIGVNVGFMLPIGGSSQLARP